MTENEVLQKLQLVLEAEQQPLSDAALKMASAIEDRYGDALLALVFYGSALREHRDNKKMLDFCVVVRSYADVYPNPALRLATALLPPGVHFLQLKLSDGQQLRCKYAVYSEKAFRKGLRGGFESMLWARLVQPCVIHCANPEVHQDVLQSFAMACLHFYREAAPLVHDGDESIWVRGLAESYRTELRPEKPLERADNIVGHSPTRYADLSAIISDCQHISLQSERRCKVRWWLRRVIGKPRGAARVLKAALTFDAGLDYVLEKVGNHSGVEIEVSDTVRRHPLLFSPVIAWRLYRAGAFR